MRRFFYYLFLVMFIMSATQALIHMIIKVGGLSGSKAGYGGIIAHGVLAGLYLAATVALGRPAKESESR